MNSGMVRRLARMEQRHPAQDARWLSLRRQWQAWQGHSVRLWPREALEAAEASGDLRDPAAAAFVATVPLADLDWWIRDQCARLGIDLAAMEAAPCGAA
ncbi:hypothetical protein QMO56_25000 [Roseomonas sp. E05]|uniref:hypothetical protein n=1 Tax=Roseomonas sp. E05 TaxID=3046310 RepID=UPI0024B967B5|nr:hypothetical protein [Roseomonas sp. E05]MDJ0391370.1 hypothetical protein [Roseomonas sp. E05]